MWLRLGNPDEALIQIEHVLNKDPANHNWTDPLNTYAKILNKLNRPNDALTQIERSLHLNNKDTDTHMIFAQTLIKLNRINEAQDAINELFTIISDKTKYNPLYSFRYEIMQTNAEILLRVNKLDEALVAIKRCLEKAPNDNRNLSIHARILLRLNKLDEAQIEIKKALDIAPNNAEDLNIYAQILIELDSYDEAYKTIERALDIEPDNAAHWGVSVKFFNKTRQLNNALVAIEKVLTLAPIDATNIHNYANILLQLNRPEEALIQIEQALCIAPGNIPSLNIKAQILLELNRLNEAQTTIEQVLKITPDDNLAWYVHAVILNKMQAELTRAACINNTFISKKYFNAALPSIHNSSDKEQRTNRNHPLIKLCTFQQIKDVERGSSLDEFNPIALKINQSEFTYYTKAPTLPSNNTPCIFIMAGRQSNAAIPTGLPAPNRIILVITEEELKSVYLAHENDIAPAILLPEGTDLLVINRLESPAYGRYEQTALINARRVAALCVAFSLELNYSMFMDDNIEELQCNNRTLTNFNQLWLMHQPNQLISSIVTSSNRSFNNTEDKKRLGSKLFLMNAIQLQQAFDFIKPEELAFFLFLPPHCSNLVMEDYYFQLLINHGLYLNNSLVQGHVALDEQTISLTRSSAHKSAAKKSANAFGAFAWLSLNTRTFITDTLVEQLSANNNCKALISLLIKDVVSDIKKIVTNNLHNTNKYLGECKITTQKKVQSGSMKNNNSLNKNQLWECIKNAPDLDLRPPQIKAIELWINEKNSGYLHAYSLATGVGKTYIKAIMAYLELACTDHPVIVVTADQKLVNNITEQFTSVFNKLNSHTQLNLSPNRIIPVMSCGKRAINQGSLAASEGFKTTQNLYVFCEDSFLKLIQERKVDVNHSSLILLDEYHCYTKTLDEAIKAVQGFTVYVGQMDEGSACYYIDVQQDYINLFDAQGTKHLLELKPSHIFDPTQIELIRSMAETNKNSVQLRDKALLSSLHDTLKLEQQKMPFPDIQQDDSNEIPFYWGHELPATSIKLVDHLPAVIPNERTTYITPMGIYQTNQAGITQCIITQDELIEHWRDSINASVDEDKNQLAQSMADYFAAFINDDNFKLELNQLIKSYKGLPCTDLDEWGQTNSPECFILTNVPPQLIYRNKNGHEKEIASGFELYQIWGFEQMTDRKNCFERIAFHQCLDLNKIAALKQLCANKQLASFPSIIRESGTNIIGFSATPPNNNPLTCVFTYSKETAEKEGYITPSIVRLMDINDFKNIPYKNIFKDVLTMNGPEGTPLCNRKGLYRFKTIDELKKAEQILKNTYNNLSVSAVYTPKGKEHGQNEKLILRNFSTIPYNQGAALLIVSKLQKGWDEPRLSYTVDFKKNPGINSAIQFLGRATRVCYDKNEQKQLIAKNKIGLGFFPTSATNVKQHLEPLKKPLPQNKTISLLYTSKVKGCIEAGDYNLNSKQMTNG
jgi:tetratricopeptide (TPR) repeat protein